MQICFNKCSFLTHLSYKIPVCTLCLLLLSFILKDQGQFDQYVHCVLLLLSFILKDQGQFDSS